MLTLHSFYNSQIINYLVARHLQTTLKFSSVLIIFLLLIGAALRFYGFPNIPFTYDELSAWGRTDYSSFTDLINKGVRGDGHPALIQVFLFYWRKIFGDTEASFKLPFLLMGLASIYLIFLLGEKWFNETTGILCAAFFSVLQYTVMYSQIARPYISGLFLSLLLANSWTNYVFGEQKRKSLSGIVIFATLCCYNHYFSFLFAVIVGCSGYFFLSRKKWREYSVAGLIVVVLFIPHIGVTLDQMKIGGVGGWLAKPDKRFFKNYINYVFEFSWWVRGLVIALIILSFFLIDREWKRKNKMRLLSAAWFLLPMIIGYLYSRYRNPVLQYSVLIFSFPFFLLLIFSFFRNLKPIILAGLTFLILGTGIYGLVFVRKHYRVFYQEPVEQMVRFSNEFVKQHPGKKIYIVIQEPWKYMNYYLTKWNSNITIHSWPDSVYNDYLKTLKIIKNENPDYLLCGNISYAHLQLFQRSFPEILEAKKGLNYDFFALGKMSDATPGINEIRYQDSIDFTKPAKEWTFDPSGVRMDSSTGKAFYHIDSLKEYGPGYQGPLHTFMQSRWDYLVLDIEVKNAADAGDASLMMSFKKGELNLFRQQKPFNFFVDSTGTGHLVDAFHFRDFNFTREDPEFNFYLWNQHHKSFDITSMKLIVMKGNPLIYSIIEPIAKGD